MFEFRLQGQALLPKISKSDFIGFFNETFFGKESRALEIHVTPQVHLEAQKLAREQRKSRVKANRGFSEVANVKKLRKQLGLHPDFVKFP